MISADLIVTIPHQAGAQSLPPFPHCDPIDSAARSIIRLINLQQQQALHIAEGHACLGQGVEPKIYMTFKLRADW